jgi:hypothetical protein
LRTRQLEARHGELSRMDATPHEGHHGSGKRKRRLSALPLLVVLFVVSYSLLTKLVIEQDKTIDSQRTLIRQLFKDNLSLRLLHKPAGDRTTASLREGKIRVEFGSQATSGSARSSVGQQTPAAQVPSGGTPSAQVQSNQVQSNQVHSSSSGPQANSKINRRGRRQTAPAPIKPPAELTDPSDMRRVSFSI